VAEQDHPTVATKAPDEQFERELADLLNRHGLDASVDIPDYILARALYQVIPLLGEAWERIRDHIQVLTVEDAIRDAVDQGLVEVVEGEPDVR